MPTKNQSKDATTRQSTLPTLTKNPGNLGDEFALNNNHAAIKLRESLSVSHQVWLAQREVERKVEVEHNSTGLPVLPALPAALLEQLRRAEASAPELLQFFSSAFLFLQSFALCPVFLQ